MLLNRSQLKNIKEEIQKQLSSGIKISKLFIENFYYNEYDNTYISNEEMIFGERITKEELINSECEDYRVVEIRESQIVVANKNIRFEVQCILKNGCDIIEEFIVLNI